MTRGDIRDLERVLEGLEGRPYPAYRDIVGVWSFPGFDLSVDHVQGDPFAAPSRVRVRLPADRAGFPEWSCRAGPRAVGLASHLARAFADAARNERRVGGSGKSGEIRMESPGQQVLVQTAVSVAPDGGVEARFTVGLPARGRRVSGRDARVLLGSAVPALVDATLRADAHDPDELARVVEANEDAEALRDALPALGLLSFVADGAVLPRASGIDDRPLEGAGVVRFESPPSLRVEVEIPNAGAITGMGVPTGVTLIVGGGFHGKSTLLRAIERGVYNHRPGDGRERVVTDRSVVRVRAEDGRPVTGVDISAFITNLPQDRDTRDFSTGNASGSTSQAAATVEAIEAGATGLLVDEDTAATNFMIRDRRMQALVPASAEPITPFVDRVRQLWESGGVSTVLVVGGSGDYLDVADTVVGMRDYRPRDETEAARRVVREHPTGRLAADVGPLPDPSARVPLPRSMDARKGRREWHARARGAQCIELGRAEIDLGAVEQIVAPAQTRALAAALLLCRRRLVDGRTPLPRVLSAVEALLRDEGLDALDDRRVGDLAEFRRFELAAAINRLRGLAVARDAG